MSKSTDNDPGKNSFTFGGIAVKKSFRGLLPIFLTGVFVCVLVALGATAIQIIIGTSVFISFLKLVVFSRTAFAVKAARDRLIASGHGDEPRMSIVTATNHIRGAHSCGHGQDETMDPRVSAHVDCYKKHFEDHSISSLDRCPSNALSVTEIDSERRMVKIYAQTISDEKEARILEREKFCSCDDCSSCGKPVFKASDPS